MKKTLFFRIVYDEKNDEKREVFFGVFEELIL